MDLGTVISKEATITINSREEPGAVLMRKKKLIQIGSKNSSIQLIEYCVQRSCVFGI